MESTLNDKILARESEDIGVEIEPEPTYLISKDTNNRIEMNPDTGEVQAASGGTLGCRSWAGKKGPSPSKNLSHPAIIDWALCEYLVFAATDKSGRTSLDKPFNPEVGLNILLSAQKKMSRTLLLNMFQNVIASSTGSIRYNFARRPGHPDEPIPLQHYNRVFIMKDETPDTVYLNAANAKKLTPVQIKNRQKNEERLQQHDETASRILQANGVTITKIPDGYEATVIKLTNIEDTWYMLIENHALKYLSDERVNFILDNLDYGKYLYLLGNSFENSWRNILPNSLPKTNMAPFTKDLKAAMAAYKNGTLDELAEQLSDKKSDKKSAKADKKPAAPHVIKPRQAPAGIQDTQANIQAGITSDTPVQADEAIAGTNPAPVDPTELPWGENARPTVTKPTMANPEAEPPDPDATPATETAQANEPDASIPVETGSDGQIALPGWASNITSPEEKAHRATLLTMLTNIQTQCRIAGDYISSNPDLSANLNSMNQIRDILDQAIQNLNPGT